jgi:hypothetical protein
MNVITGTPEITVLPKQKDLFQLHLKDYIIAIG